MTRSVRDACPECGSQQFKKNGHIHTGKQNHQCKDCGRQFVVEATQWVIDEEHRTLVERLRCEKISLHGICRTIGVSMRWLMDFMVACFAVEKNILTKGKIENRAAWLVREPQPRPRGRFYTGARV